MYGVLSLARSRSKSRKLQSIIAFSKVLIDREQFEAKDERLMRRFLLAQDVKEKQIEDLLKTTPESGREQALQHLSAQERMEVARYIFPLVYADDGVISAGYRRRFARVCAQLDLEADAAATISQDYRERLDRQWAYLRNMVRQLNYFANSLVFDGQEMELLREQVAQLAQFDPRRAAAKKRDTVLGLLGRAGEAAAALSETDVLVEAAAMGAYALAQTAIQDSGRRAQLQVAFDVLVDSQSEISQAYKETLVTSRKKVDKLYDATRAQILAATRKRPKDDQKGDGPSRSD